MKLTGIKLKMTQVWKGDKLEPVSVVKISEGEGLADLKPGDSVKVIGTTRSLGWQGVVKRHGFGGGPMTHGAKNRMRAPGSIGNTSPQRIIPGRRMAGRMGGKTQTLKNVKIIEVDAEAKTLSLRGPVPGYKKKNKLIIQK
jgi:large subunit ribosomal protein L3